MKKQPIKTKEIEFALQNGIVLLVSSWVRAKHKSNRFNSPITRYDVTDWYISIELKTESDSDIHINPTLATFNNSDTVKDLNKILNALQASLQTKTLFLKTVRELRDSVVLEAVEWNEKFDK